MSMKELHLLDTLNVPAGGGTDVYPGTGTARNLRVVVSLE